MNKVFLLVAVLSSASAIADGVSWVDFVRLPKNKCTGNSCGDPAVVSSVVPFPFQRETDITISTPRGPFVLTRTWTALRESIGQTLPAEKADDECGTSVLNTVAPGLLKSPHGESFSDRKPIFVNTLSSIVDTRCSPVTRVITPQGDTRFFGVLPPVATNGSAWVPRHSNAQGERSRLRAWRDANGNLGFSWFSETGERFEYFSRFSGIFGDNGQYRLGAGFRGDGVLLYEVQHGFPVGNAIPGETGEPAVLANGNPKIYPGTSQAIGACSATIEPLQVHFPDSDVFLRLIYRNPPSTFSNGNELPNFDCVLARIEVVNGSNVEVHTEYTYQIWSQFAAGITNSNLVRAIFRANASPSAWTLEQPGLNPTTMRWARGIVSATPREIANGKESAVIGSSELTAEHNATIGADGGLGRVLYSFKEDQQTNPPFIDFKSRATPTGCTNCCDEAGFQRNMDNTSGSYLQMNYLGLNWNLDFGPLPSADTKTCMGSVHSCESGTAFSFYGRSGNSSGAGQSAGSCGLANQPPSLLASRDRTGSFFAKDVAFSSGKGGVFQDTKIKNGATDMVGTSALEETRFSYTFTADTALVVSEMRTKSVLDPAVDAVTTFNRADNGRITSVVRSGYSRTSGGKVWQYMATFYRTGTHSCGGTIDPSTDRITEIEGPCLVLNPTDNACAYPAEAPRTELYYYGTALPSGVTFPESATNMFNSGRLGVVRKFRGDCSSTPVLVWSFGSYSAGGAAGRVVDPNGQTTLTARDGEYVRQISLPTGVQYSMEWDRGRLARLTRPEGDATVNCYGTAALPPVGAPAAPGASPDAVCARHGWTYFPTPPGGWNPAIAPLSLSDSVQWSSDLAVNETVVRQTRNTYDRDFLAISTLAAGTEVFLRTQRDADVEQREKAAGIGQASLSGRAFRSVRFDANSQMTAMGSGFDFVSPSIPLTVEPFCTTNGTTGDNPLCTYFERDRLGRLQGTTWGLSLSTNPKDCFGYDSQGNISVITRGCPGDSQCSFAPTTASIAGTSGSVSGGPTCSTHRFEYLWDDFGNLTSFRRKVNGSWSEDYNDTLNGAGIPSRRQTEAQRAANQYNTFMFDALGRTTSVVSTTSATPTTLSSTTWDAIGPPPSGCTIPSTSNRLGRIAGTTNPVWTTRYAYDADGRTLLESRVLTGATGCAAGGFNSTSYTYTPNGNIASIRYPYGRLAQYGYPGATSGLDPNLPIKITVDAFSSSSTVVPLDLITEITWTPTKELKSYLFNHFVGLSGGSGILAGQTRVTYDYSVVGSETRPSSCGQGITDPQSTADGMGRLRRMKVVTVPANTVLYERWYTWATDEVVAIDTCYEGQTGAPLNEFLAPVGSTPLGYDRRKQLTESAVATAGGNIVDNRKEYAYDALGNRTSEWSPYRFGMTIDSSSSQMTRRAPLNLFTGAELSGNRAYRVYGSDADGRNTSMTAATDSTGQPNWTRTFTFPGGTSVGNGGVDSVLRTANLDGQVYNYFYDGSNRRQKKVYPNMAFEYFFYDQAGQLISEQSFTGLSNSSGTTFDEYIWLAGRPIGSIRSVFDANFVRKADWNPSGGGVCPRRNTDGRCGMNSVVTDHLARPVAAFDGNLRLTGVGEYDPFGFINRVQAWSETAHPYSNNQTTTLATGVGRLVTSGSSNQRTVFRARFDFVDANTSLVPCWLGWCATNDRIEVLQGSTVLAEVKGQSLGAATAPWLTQQGTFNIRFVSDNTLTGDGAVYSGYDYDRISVNATRYFPPLRFPGQYYDEESDLHENWNRYYDPLTGRYLSADPLLNSPNYLAAMSNSGLGVAGYAYAANNPLRYVDVDGRTTMIFYMEMGWLYVDPERPGRAPYLVRATSGSAKQGCMNDGRRSCQGTSEGGPIPEGYYELFTKKLDRPSPAQSLGRNILIGDWGSFRVRLEPTQTFPNKEWEGKTWSGRQGFYLHGGSKPGSWGCIDIGGGDFGDINTNAVVTDILWDPDGYVPVTVFR